MKGIQWIELILGLWIVVSPWLVVSVLNISNVIAGIIVILIACVELFGGKSTPQV